MPPRAANRYSLEVAPVPLNLRQVLDQLRTEPAWVQGIQAWEARLAAWLDGVPSETRAQVVPVLQALLKAGAEQP